MRKRTGFSLFSFCLVLALTLFAFACPFGEPAHAATGSVFTRYNIHAQNQKGRYKASYANFTHPGPGHVIIPAGSRITIGKVSRKMIQIHVPDKNIDILFEVHEPRMGMKAREYIDKITSPDPVSHAKLPALDRKGIAEGQVFVGMTKAGVMAALGYPAAHRTPSLDSSTYVYWTNRFRTMAVEFDGTGKVKKISN